MILGFPYRTLAQARHTSHRTRQEGGTTAKYPAIACLTAVVVAVLIALVSWLGVGSRETANDVVGVPPTPQGTSLAASAVPASESPSLGSSLKSLTRTSTPTPAPPPTIVPTASSTPIQPQPDPIRVPQATGARPVPIATPVPTPNPTPYPTAAPDPTLAEQLVALINAERAAIGVPRLDPNAALRSAAQDYATFHFLQPDPFQLDHHLDGGPLDRVQRKGYTGAVGEVLVTGSPKAANLMEAWLNSPPHEDILLSAKYRDVGVGCYSGPFVDDDGRTLDIALCVGLVGYR